MATRKHKQGLKYQVGDEVSFYQDGEVRTGIVSFVGEIDSLRATPSEADILGANGDPLKSIEYTISEDNIL